MNELSITIFILILPGIISLLVISSLVSSAELSSFFFILYSIILGLFSYCFLQLFIWTAPFLTLLLDGINVGFDCLSVWEIIGLKKGIGISPGEVICATLLAIPLGLIVTMVINYKILFKIAKRLNVSSKYGDENLFSYYLNTNEVDWVYIRDKENETIYQGRVLHYSENEKIQEIVLSDMTAFTYYDPKFAYSAPSVYICRELGKMQIEQIPKENFDEIKRGGKNGES